MSIFTTNLKRIFKSKIQLIFIIVFPLSIMSLAFIQNGFELRVGLVDQDQTPLTAALAEELESKVKISSLREEDIQKEMMKLNYDLILVIPGGYTDDLIAGKDPQFEGYTIQETNVSDPIKAYVDSFAYNMKQLAQSTQQSQENFYQALSTYQNGRVGIEYLSTLDENWSQTRAALGYMTLAMLYTSAISAMLTIMNKNNGTLYRTLLAPVSLRNYMLQNIASLMAVAVVQIVMIFSILVWGFDLYLGKSVLSMLLLFVLFAVVCVALGVLISSFSKTVVQAGLITICVVPLLGMLGGSYWPVDQVPDSLQSIAQFVPVTWAMDGAEKLLRDQSLLDIGKNLAILLLYSIIFFIVGTIRKVDLAK